MIDFPAITRMVAETGYDGPVEVEIFNADIWAAPADGGAQYDEPALARAGVAVALDIDQKGRVMTAASPEEPVRFAAVGLDHSHIFGQIKGLLEQGGTLVGVSSMDPEASVAQEVRRRWPDAPWVDDPA